MIYYLLSKILPLFILPLGLSLILILSGKLFSNKKIIQLAFAILWIFSLGFISELLWNIVESPWKRIQAPNASYADAIVVLSGGIHPAPGVEEIIEWSDPDRFLAGIELFKEKKAPRVVFTGGSSPFDSKLSTEGKWYAKKAINLGIPKSAIIVTKPVKNTAEEALEVNKILIHKNSIDLNKVLLVTSAFHMQRASHLFKSQGFIVIPFPVDFKSRGSWAGKTWKNPLAWIPNANSLASSSRAIRELLGRIIYKSW